MKQAVSQLTLGYSALLEDLKHHIQAAQVRASLAVNRELVLLHWEIGDKILTSQKQEGWGAKVIDRLADDLRQAFPEVAGFSRRNLLFMRAFAEAFPDVEIVKQVVSQIPWGHILRLLQMVKGYEERMFYIRQTVEHGWSRAILIHQIETGLHRRLGKALNNFDRVLPAPQSDLARQTLKDPYILDFLTLGPDAQERELEQGLLGQVRHFLMELGAGFALVGSQYLLEVDGQSFYLSAVDNLLRHAEDQPTIGLILCKTKSRLIAEYTLQGVQRPIGVATYQRMPDYLRGTLPSPEQLETMISEP